MPGVVISLVHALQHFLAKSHFYVPATKCVKEAEKVFMFFKQNNGYAGFLKNLFVPNICSLFHYVIWSLVTIRMKLSKIYGNR